MDKLKTLLTILSDGEFHSGEAIGNELNITRAGVWKLVRQAKNTGFSIQGISRQGYKLMQPISFLSAKKINSFLSDECKSNLKCLEIFNEIDSTNTYLLQRIYEFSKIPRACLSELQTQGRGRRGRLWHSPYAQNIYLSLLWKFDPSKTDFQGLSLVIALAVANVLEKLNLPHEIKLKWPNDIFIAEKKLSGILIETRGEMHDGAQVVIGVGINVNMTTRSAHKINQPWISLFQLLKKTVDRNKLAADLIHEIMAYLKKFNTHGFTPFKKAWEKYDMTYGLAVKIECHDNIISGVARGIDDAGRLQIETNENNKIAINVGDVSWED